MAPSPTVNMEGDDAMQKYQLLSSQQEVLRRRLSLHIPSPSPMTASSPEFQSLSSSPTSSRPIYSSSWTPEPSFSPTTSPQTMSAYPIPISPSSRRNSIDEPLNEDAHRLYEINQQIKATLTELLNTESARHDDKYRAWIQGRLMDAEHEIRRQRRHRSSVDSEMAKSIAEHFP